MCSHPPAHSDASEHTQTAHIYPLTHTFTPHNVGTESVHPQTYSGEILERWRSGQSPRPAAWGSHGPSPLSQLILLPLPSASRWGFWSSQAAAEPLQASVAAPRP